MKDKDTGLTIRTLDATEKYIAEHIIRNNSNYTFPQALKDSGYTQRYIHSFGSRIWHNVGVQTKIDRCKAKITAKVELNAEKVLKDLDLAETALLENGVLPRRNVIAFLKIVEFRGKYLALWTENLNTTDIVRQRELDVAEQAEAVELARLRLASKYGLIKADVKPGEGQRKVCTGTDDAAVTIDGKAPGIE